MSKNRGSGGGETKLKSKGVAGGNEHFAASGSGGGGGTRSSDGFLISKILINPSRKIGLPEYSSVDLSAGMEVVFDRPVPVGSDEIQNAFDRVHEVLQKEFRKQLELFGQKKKSE